MEAACAALVKKQIESQLATMPYAMVPVKRERDEDEESRESDVQIIEGRLSCVVVIRDIVSNLKASVSLVFNRQWRRNEHQWRRNEHQ